MSITREEAIKFAHHAYDMTDIPDVKEFYAIAENALREQEQHRWIPVTERLPEDLCPVLVSLKGLKKAFVGRYQDSEWWSEGASSRPFILEVTHWMPLPEPPEEEEK